MTLNLNNLNNLILRTKNVISYLKKSRFYFTSVKMFAGFLNVCRHWINERKLRFYWIPNFLYEFYRFASFPNRTLPIFWIIIDSLSRTTRLIICFAKELPLDQIRLGIVQVSTFVAHFCGVTNKLSRAVLFFRRK